MFGLFQLFPTPPPPPLEPKVIEPGCKRGKQQPKISVINQVWRNFSARCYLAATWTPNCEPKCHRDDTRTEEFRRKLHVFCGGIFSNDFFPVFPPCCSDDGFDYADLFIHLAAVLSGWLYNGRFGESDLSPEWRRRKLCADCFRDTRRPSGLCYKLCGFIMLYLMDSREMRQLVEWTGRQL